MGDVKFEKLSDVFLLNEDGEPEQILNIKNIEEQTTSVDELDPGMFPIRFNDRREFSCSCTLTRRSAIDLVRFAWGWRSRGPIRRRNLMKARANALKVWWRNTLNDLCNR